MIQNTGEVEKTVWLKEEFTVDILLHRLIMKLESSNHGFYSKPIAELDGGHSPDFPEPHLEVRYFLRDDGSIEKIECAARKRDLSRKVYYIEI